MGIVTEGELKAVSVAGTVYQCPFNTINAILTPVTTLNRGCHLECYGTRNIVNHSNTSDGHAFAFCGTELHHLERGGLEVDTTSAGITEGIVEGRDDLGDGTVVGWGEWRVGCTRGKRKQLGGLGVVNKGDFAA